MLNRRFFLLLLSALLLSGCNVFDTVISGDKQIPFSQYAEDSFIKDIESMNFKIRKVYDPKNRYVLTYVVGFDGTNNHSGCEREFAHSPNFFDQLTNKPACTSIQRLTYGSKADIISFGYASENAARIVHYYPGPGTFGGRFPNFVDSVLGYSASSISQQALSQLEEDLKHFPNYIKEVRLVAIGFSRGAAVARDFINRAHSSWNSTKGRSQKLELWSTMLLIDTVATFQENHLQLKINPGTEQVVHLISRNEARKQFRPIQDQPVNSGSIYERLIVLSTPGAHSDAGAAYRFGAGVFSEYAAYRAAFEMGLLQTLDKNYKDIPNYGLIDSRGLIDSLTQTPSGYACGFKRTPAKMVEMAFSQKELFRYLDRIDERKRNEDDLRKTGFSKRRYIQKGRIALKVKSNILKWEIINNICQENCGYALVKGDIHSGYTLTIHSLLYKGQTEIPNEVIEEIKRHQGKTVQVDIVWPLLRDTKTFASQPRFFVNGCLPTEKI